MANRSCNHSQHWWSRYNKGKVTAAIAKAFAEKEFEKFRVLQDRTYQSDFDRLVAETSDDLTE